MRRRRAGAAVSYRLEELRCVCEPGKFAHPAHARPASKIAKHFDPRCPHSELALTTAPGVGRKASSFRIEL